MKMNGIDRTRTLCALLCALALAAMGPASLAGQGAGDPTTAEEGALFLLLPAGSQAVGLSRAMTAISSAESAFWNPAGLATLGASTIILHRGEHLVGDATSISALLHSEGRGTLGVSYQLLDAGTQALTDIDGNTLGSISVRNHQAIVSASARVLDRVSAGMNVKHVRFEFSCRGQCPEGRVRGTSYAVDLGAQIDPFTDLPLRIGVLATHIGPSFQIENAEQADPLPARLRIAAAYEAFQWEIEEEPVGLLMIMEVEDRIRDLGSPAYLLGMELHAGSEDRIVARGGYSLGNTDHLDGAAIGLGLRFDRLDVGIARSLARSGSAAQEEPVHITLGLRF